MEHDLLAYKQQKKFRHPYASKVIFGRHNKHLQEVGDLLNTLWCNGSQAEVLNQINALLAQGSYDDTSTLALLLGDYQDRITSAINNHWSAARASP